MTVVHVGSGIRTLVSARGGYVTVEINSHSETLAMSLQRVNPYHGISLRIILGTGVCDNLNVFYVVA